jgi:Putative zinc-finger
MTPCRMDDYVGAYVLSALEPDEAELVRAHVDRCSECSEEVAQLAGTVARLALLTLADVDQGLGLGAPKPRPRYGARLVGVACLLALGAGGGAVAARAPLHPAVAATVRAADPATHVTGVLTISTDSSRTRVHLSMRGAYPGRICRLVVQGRTGVARTASSWVAADGGRAEVDARTNIPPDRITAFAVTTGSGRTLIRFAMPHRRP